jgi:hypothetical protein
VGIPSYYGLAKILFDVDRIAIPEDGKTKVLMTIVGGKIAYQNPSWEGARPAGF